MEKESVIAIYLVHGKQGMDFLTDRHLKASAELSAHWNRLPVLIFIGNTQNLVQYCPGQPASVDPGLSRAMDNVISRGLFPHQPSCEITNTLLLPACIPQVPDLCPLNLPTADLSLSISCCLIFLHTHILSYMYSHSLGISTPVNLLYPKPKSLDLSSRSLVTS